MTGSPSPVRAGSRCSRSSPPVGGRGATAAGPGAVVGTTRGTASRIARVPTTTQVRRRRADVSPVPGSTRARQRQVRPVASPATRPMPTPYPMAVATVINVVAIHQLSGPASSRWPVSAATTDPTTPRPTPATSAESQTASQARSGSRRSTTRTLTANRPRKTAVPASVPSALAALVGASSGPANAYPTGPPRQFEPTTAASATSAAVTATAKALPDPSHGPLPDVLSAPGAPSDSASEAAPEARRRRASTAAAPTRGPATRPLRPANPLVATVNSSAAARPRCGP